MEEDIVLVRELEKVFNSRELQLVVNHINTSETIVDLLREINKHQEYMPLYRTIGPKLISLNNDQVDKLISLSHNIVNRGYELHDIIPLKETNGEGLCIGKE